MHEHFLSRQKDDRTWVKIINFFKLWCHWCNCIPCLLIPLYPECLLQWGTHQSYGYLPPTKTVFKWTRRTKMTNISLQDDKYQLFQMTKILTLNTRFAIWQTLWQTLALQDDKFLLTCLEARVKRTAWPAHSFLLLIAGHYQDTWPALQMTITIVQIFPLKDYNDESRQLCKPSKHCVVSLYPSFQYYITYTLYNKIARCV